MTQQQLSALALVVPIAIATAGCEAVKPRDVVITQQQLQEQLDSRLPLTHEGVLYDTVIKRGKVTILDKPAGRVRLDLELTNSASSGGAAKLLKRVSDKADKTREIKPTVSASLRYVPDKGAFYLDDFHVDALAVEDLTADERAKVHKLVEMGMGIWFDNVPAYTLGGADFKEQAAKLMLRDVSVKDGALHIHLGLPGNSA